MDTANAEVNEIKTLLPESDEEERGRRDSFEDGQETTVEDGLGGKTNNVSGEVDKGTVLVEFYMNLSPFCPISLHKHIARLQKRKRKADR